MSLIISEGAAMQGVANSAGVAFTLMGKDAYRGGSPALLAQGLIADSEEDIYINTLSTRLNGPSAEIETIVLANTTSSPISGVTLYIEGTQISPAFVIPAKGCAIYESGGWKVYNTSGEVISSTGGSGAGMYGVAENVNDGDTITHGSSVAPRVAFANGAVIGEEVKVTSIDATTITVSIKTYLGAPGTQQNILWQVLP